MNAIMMSLITNSNYLSIYQFINLSIVFYRKRIFSEHLRARFFLFTMCMKDSMHRQVVRIIVNRIKYRVRRARGILTKGQNSQNEAIWRIMKDIFFY
jgi:hypothetical protein